MCCMLSWKPPYFSYWSVSVCKLVCNLYKLLTSQLERGSRGNELRASARTHDLRCNAEFQFSHFLYHTLCMLNVRQLTALVSGRQAHAHHSQMAFQHQYYHIQGQRIPSASSGVVQTADGVL